MTATVDGLALDSNAWHHVTVTTYAEDAVFYVNGSVVGVMRLEGPIVDNPSRDITLGQIATCEYPVYRALFLPPLIAPSSICSCIFIQWSDAGHLLLHSGSHNEVCTVLYMVHIIIITKITHLCSYDT